MLSLIGLSNFQLQLFHDHLITLMPVRVNAMWEYREKYITFKWIYLFSLSCEIFFFFRSFGFVSVNFNRKRNGKKIERERLMMLKSWRFEAKTAQNGMAKLELIAFFLFFLAGRLLLSFLDYHLHSVVAVESTKVVANVFSFWRTRKSRKVSVSSSRACMTLNSHSKSPHADDNGDVGRVELNRRAKKESKARTKWVRTREKWEIQAIISDEI